MGLRLVETKQLYLQKLFKGGFISIFIIAFIIGLVLPILCLGISWQQRDLRLHGIFFIALLLVQIISEALLARFNLLPVIKYSSAVFVLLRILYLAYLFRLKALLTTFRDSNRFIMVLSYWANCLLWPLILLRLISKITT